MTYKKQEFDMVELIALCTAGLEAAPSFEIKKNGYKIINSSSGKVQFLVSLKDIPFIVTHFRTVDRILIKINEFKVSSFDELYDNIFQTKWKDYIEKNGKVVVERVKITNSKLSATGAVASVIKKAIYENLKKSYKTNIWVENEIIYPLYIYLKNNKATICLDTTYKDSLAKRGYRITHLPNSIRETIAASLVILSKWNKDYTLIDPFCGSGTIPIEAALHASNSILRKDYAFLQWKIFKDVNLSSVIVNNTSNYDIYGYDKNYRAIEIAKENAKRANVKVHFEKKSMESLEKSDDLIYFISNLPYGINVEDNIKDTYRKMRYLSRAFPNAKFFFITPEEKFEEYFEKRANKKFKFQNSGIWVWYYLFYE